MKRKKIITILLVFLIVIVCSIFIGSDIIKKRTKIKHEKRYSEIRENVKKAVEWNIKAQYPKCPITNNNKESKGASSFYNSSFLINQGYIKKEELKDIDGETYCDVYVKINPYYEDPLDQQKNCEISYKIFLSCKDYTDKGYIDWGK